MQRAKPLALPEVAGSPSSRHPKTWTCRAAALRTFEKVQTASVAALEAQQKRINQMFKFGAMSEDDWKAECRAIGAQRERLQVRPAPLLQQQQSVLTTLVQKWDAMTADERKRMLAAIFDTVTADGEGVARLEPCEDWRPYVVAALPEPVKVLPAANRAEDGTLHPQC
jgi:hypothetical protein